MALVSRLPSLLFRVVPVTGSQASAQWGERVPVSRAAGRRDGTQKAGTALLTPECLQDTTLEGSRRRSVGRRWS